MNMIPGEVYCLKVTGEKVFVLSTNLVSNSEMSVNVRRPEISDAGRITHHNEVFTANELETLDEHAERQIREVLLKNTTSNRLNKLIEAENAQPTTLAKPAEPKVN